MNRRSLLVRTGALGLAAGGAWWMRDKVFWPPPGIRFDPVGVTPWLAWAAPVVLPIVRVGIGGRTINALIDSGAPRSTMERTLFSDLGGRKEVGVPMVAWGLGGRAQPGPAGVLDVRLPGLAIRGLRAALLDFGPLFHGGPAKGLGLILGQDVLRQLVLELDPAARRVRLADPERFVPEPSLIAAPVRRQRGLSADVSVEGAVVSAMIDTGSSSLLALDRATAKTAGLMDGRPQQRAASLVVGGLLKAAAVEARTVTFASQIYRRVEVGVYDHPPLSGFPPALVGMAAFEDRRAALDLGRGRLHVSRTLELTVGR